MGKSHICLFIVSIFFFLHSTYSIEQDERKALIAFLEKLSNSNGALDPGFDWTLETDPCIDQWKGVKCNRKNTSVTRLLLNRLNLAGTLDIGPVCSVKSVAKSFSILHLDGNNIGGEVPKDISMCKKLNGLYLGGNRFSGRLPDSLSSLNNLRRLDISNNNFSGDLPNLARISGLTLFAAENNQLTGKIPKFDFSNLDYFNVSYNNFSGSIPKLDDYFDESSFLGNPLLCGAPYRRKCPDRVSKKILVYSGSAALGLFLAGFVAYKIIKRKKKVENVEAKDKVMAVDDNSKKLNAQSGTDVSTCSVDNGTVSRSLVVLTSPNANGLKFEYLLSAPAELLGRGKHSSLYKVICDNGMTFAVKRIKDWAISGEEFKKRMQMIDQVKHPNVLPAAAFYSSKQEKLLVYEFQQNGSLFRLLHGIQAGQAFEWFSRLNVAASIAEALAVMHREFANDGIAHGNLKSSNIMFSDNMDPCISEYGLMINADIDSSSNLSNIKGPEKADRSGSSAFKADVYGFGVILLELLTGKLVRSNASDLTKWVRSVLSEEWTVEVFDKSLISEGASEERMVHLLQVAIKCVNIAPSARPDMNQVAAMINRIKEEEDQSLACEP